MSCDQVYRMVEAFVAAATEEGANIRACSWDSPHLVSGSFNLADALSAAVDARGGDADLVLNALGREQPSSARLQEIRNFLTPEAWDVVRALVHETTKIDAEQAR
jgi:hypothetical protein